MPTRSKDPKKCTHCPRVFQGRGLAGYDKHVRACAREREEARELRRIQSVPKRQKRNPPLPTVVEETNQSHIDAGHPPDDFDRFQAPDPIFNVTNGCDVYGPHLPSVYILLRPHHHARQSENACSVIVPLDQATEYAGPAAPVMLRRKDINTRLPTYHPFKCEADFEVAEFAVLNGLSDGAVNHLLAKMDGKWAENKLTTFRNHDDLNRALKFARRYVVPFQTDSVLATFEGTEHRVEIEYRDPWACAVNYATDPSLAPHITWYSYRKFYCEDGVKIEMPLYDDPATGSIWHEVDDELDAAQKRSHGHLPHCYFPWQIWFDKGNMTKHLKLHPMIIRPCFVPSAVANGSGNGGGIFIGFIRNIPPLDKSKAGVGKTRGTVYQQAYSRFRAEIYQKVLGKVFCSWYDRSRYGEALTCGDGRRRILHPGVLIKSMDAQEHAECNCVRHASADVPCFQCLVPQNRLSDLRHIFPRRTVKNMRDILAQARGEDTSASEKSKLLQKNGMHDLEPFMWNLRFSDPYRSSVYDKLHSPDSGLFGKHAWPAITDYLRDEGLLGQYEKNTSEIARWRSLRHFERVASREYYDANVYMDVSRCLPACIVQLFPPNSAVVHWARAYQHVRMLLGLECNSENRLNSLHKRILKLCDISDKFTGELGKSLNFLKMHLLQHVIDDIRGAGSTVNGDTRKNEGFHQELKSMLSRTNFKDIERQIDIQDMNREIIARIRMYVDNEAERFKKEKEREHEELTGDDNDGAGQDPADPSSVPEDASSDDVSPHWKLWGRVRRGADTSATYSRTVGMPKFDVSLRTFLEHTFGEDAPPRTDALHMKAYKTLYLYYQSLADWTEAHDILHASPKFQGRPRYDCAVLNVENNASRDQRMSFVRLQGMFRCKLRSGKEVDVALVKRFQHSKWKPRTAWDGCQVEAEVNRLEFILIQYLVRGAHLITAFGAPTNRKEGLLFFFNDCIDNDMYLRNHKLYY
ncbi:unnamed protein product [Peniophora sp. CBMAI 1063]|nr:unnamed protein product [Peniophora sp. CBMAI 1063]